MYIASVTLLMVVLPTLSVLVEALVTKDHAALLALIGKWFIFWAVGVRLFTAGIRQSIKPGLTAEGILGIKDEASWVIVRELGFANISMGLAGIASLWLGDWRQAVALIASIFLLLDAFQHVRNKRNLEENVAMYSDFFIGLVMVVYLLGSNYAALQIFNPGATIHFVYYEPSYLPPNVSIKEKNLSIVDGPEGYAESAVLNFRTENAVYSIGEFNNRTLKDSIGSANQDYDETSVKPSCNILNTPQGMRYRLCHWIDYGRINVHEVKFIKNGTYIDARIPSNLDDSISIDEISKFVDSFKQKSTDGVPVKRSRYFA